MSNAKTLLSKETTAIIDHWLKKYPEGEQRSAVLAALMAAQQQNEGWLSSALMDAVADYLALPNVWVYEVATFYDMYDVKFVGKRKIRVCTNVSCMLCGANEIVAILQKKLGVGFNETTKDGQFVLQEAECLAACTRAPMMMVDLDYYENLTPRKVEQIIDKLQHEEEVN